MYQDLTTQTIIDTDSGAVVQSYDYVNLNNDSLLKGLRSSGTKSLYLANLTSGLYTKPYAVEGLSAPILELVKFSGTSYSI
jgi:hypothetical protein